ncbi:MAG: undecaprenyldiphospho-muramoylpentapeptide beta-N-acetylglucosaminyltransferase [Erysipelotrichaceae bacterium]|nr:undecaprenyldiphospho-muramoylpentapeptide beta-N-acetylglucosaminyltransferase [Erysipelotrichaceae bacterium]
MKKICLATGGTGGHIYPALALAQEWKNASEPADLFFIGNDDRMEARLIPNAGFKFYGLRSSGLEGSVWHKIKAVLQMSTAFMAARKILKKEKPDLVMGFGGYVSAPVLMAAQSMGIPTMIHEQNSVVGKANRLVMNRVDGIVTCYEKCHEVFDSNKTRLLGNPRATVAAHAQKDLDYFLSLGLDPNKKTVLIVMGSLGSASVNKLMKSALQGLDESLQVLYATGAETAVEQGLFDGMPNIHVQPFVDTMKLYGFLDGMICRAGATTLAEATALGIPMIIIPSPYVANNHQYYNARMLTDRNAALMIEEKDLNAQALKSAIEQGFMNDDKRLELAANARKAGRPHAAQDIIAFANECMAAKKQSSN